MNHVLVVGNWTVDPSYRSVGNFGICSNWHRWLHWAVSNRTEAMSKTFSTIVINSTLALDGLTVGVVSRIGATATAVFTPDGPATKPALSFRSFTFFLFQIKWSTTNHGLMSRKAGLASELQTRTMGKVITAVTADAVGIKLPVPCDCCLVVVLVAQEMHQSKVGYRSYWRLKVSVDNDKICIQ